MIRSELFPLHKEAIIKEVGYISYQLVLANVDVLGIRIRKSQEVVIITFNKATKTGYMYEGGSLTPEQVYRVYQDVPEDRNLIAEYEEKFGDKVDILEPPKHNYVFQNEKYVKEIQPKK